MAVVGMAAAARLPPAAACRTRLAAAHPPFLTMPPIQSRSRLVVAASAQNNFSRVVQTAWRVGKDAVEAGTTLVPGSVPRPIARIGVTLVAVSVALFLFKSVVSTAFFVLAMTGLIYFGFLAMNPKEGSKVGEGANSSNPKEGSKVDGGANSSEDPVEEARRIMEKYK